MSRNATQVFSVEYDGYKFGFTTGSISVAKKSALTTKLGFAGFPIPTGTDTVTLISNLGTANANYTITLAGLDKATGFNYYLYDRFTNTVSDMSATNTTYQFNVVASNAASYNQNRFSVIITNTASLPVVMTNLKATKSGEVVDIIWTTSSELNNSHFVVENSTDGKTFTQIGAVKGNGTTNTTIQYSFVHTTPAKAINYYRLRQVDFDGSESFSYTVMVNMMEAIVTSEISVFPVPARDNLNIKLNQHTADEVVVEVIDILGQTVVKRKLKVSGSLAELDIHTLEPGTYFVKIGEHTNSTQKAKFIKN